MIKVLAHPYRGFVEVDVGKKRPLLFKRSKKVSRVVDDSCAACGGPIEKDWDLYYFSAKRVGEHRHICTDCGDTHPDPSPKMARGMVEGFHSDLVE